jgi:hypothetical protein
VIPAGTGFILRALTPPGRPPGAGDRDLNVGLAWDVVRIARERQEAKILVPAGR